MIVLLASVSLLGCSTPPENPPAFPACEPWPDVARGQQAERIVGCTDAAISLVGEAPLEPTTLRWHTHLLTLGWTLEHDDSRPAVTAMASAFTNRIYGTPGGPTSMTVTAKNGRTTLTLARVP